jgi:hypothetical protein
MTSSLSSLNQKLFFLKWHIGWRNLVISAERKIHFNLTLPTKIFVLEYDDVEDTPCYQHLDARGEKEKSTSNCTTKEAVKANTVVFTSLALLFNLCSSSNLERTEVERNFPILDEKKS